MSSVSKSQKKIPHILNIQWSEMHLTSVVNKEFVFFFKKQVTYHSHIPLDLENGFTALIPCPETMCGAVGSENTFPHVLKD